MAGTVTLTLSSPPAPGNLRSTGSTSSSISLAWDAVPSAVNYALWRDGAVIVVQAGTTYDDTGRTADTTYLYTVSAFRAGGESAQSSAVNVTTQASASQTYFTSSFETGSKSEWNQAAFGAGTVDVLNAQIGYQGAYYARAAMVTGTSNNNSVFHDYGTPSNLGTQIRNYWLQFAVSHDSFTGSWVTTKIAYMQYYDATQGDTTFSNVFRDYQQIIALNSSGQYFVEIAKPELPNQQFIALGQNTANGTNHGPTAGSWDVLRLQVQLDTNGSGALGAGNGNGIVRLWKNGTLILDYSNVNLCNGNPNVGCGRILLTNQTAATWTGTASNMYWDDVRVVSDVSLLPAMPSSPSQRIPSANIIYDAAYTSTTNLGTLGTQATDGYGTSWSSQILATGGPSGQRAYQYWQLVDPTGQHGWGHYFDPLPTASAYFVRLRFRVDAPDAGKTNFLAVSQPGGGDGRSRDKWLMWPSSDASRFILNVEGWLDTGTATYDNTSFVVHNGEWSFEMIRDGLGGGMQGCGPFTTGVWYDIQIEMNTNGFFRVWVDDMTYANQRINYNGGSSAPYREMLLGGYANGGLRPGGQFRMTHCDLEIGTTFNASW